MEWGVASHSLPLGVTQVRDGLEPENQKKKQKEIYSCLNHLE